MSYKSIIKTILIFTLSVFSAASFSLGKRVEAKKQFRFQQETLAVHNQLRMQHDAPKLVWDDALASYAEKYASACEFKHSHGPYGENLAAGYTSITAATKAWYSEIDKYSYSKPGFSKNTGHFTQLIWASSTKIGCGYADCDGKNGTPGIYWVCEYSPAGNVINDGYFNANVLPKHEVR